MERIFRGLLTLGIACLGLLLYGPFGTAEVVDRIVAEVNDEIITLSELKAASKSIEAQTGIRPQGKEGKDFERQMLEALIDRKLAKAEAKRRGMTVEDKDLAAALNNFRKKNRLEDDEAFSKALSKANLTLKELKQTLTDQIIQERMLVVAVGAKSVVSDAEVRRVYEQQFKEGGDRLHLRVIQIPFTPGMTEAQKEELKKKAETVIIEVKKGASFKEVAAKLSLDERDVGFVPVSEMDPKLVEFLGRLRPSEVAPALTPQGIQLIQLVERRAGGPRPFEELQGEIRNALSQKEMEKRFGEWVKTLREKAHIKIML